MEIYKLIYKKENNVKNVRILGETFMKNNRNKGVLIINNRKFHLKDKVSVNNINEDIIKIKMILNRYTCNFSCMFRDCTNLEEAPELPATTLELGCYSGMFRGCTSIEESPVLPATTLVGSCYNNMFRSCSSLSRITAMFTTTPGTTYTNGWVNGVAASGIFIKNAAATWTTTGVNGVPTGWTVQTASE